MVSTDRAIEKELKWIKEQNRGYTRIYQSNGSRRRIRKPIGKRKGNIHMRSKKWKVGDRVKIREDVVSHYRGKEGVIRQINDSSSKYNHIIKFKNEDYLAFRKDELVEVERERVEFT